MTALVLHIGDPKTGSSSIQKILFEKEWRCESRTLDYPRTMNAFKLVNALKPDTRPYVADTRYAEYNTWLKASRADVAVISAETFSQMDPVIVNNAMHRYFPEHAPTMRVVAYARPHVSRFLSAYVQRTKTGLMNSSLEEFLVKVTTKGLLSFHDRFSKWRDVFGSSFVLRPMEREVLRDGDVVTDFLDVVLGDVPFSISGSTQSNMSMPVEALAGLRMIHAVLSMFKLPADTPHAVGARINTLVAMAGLTGTKLCVSQVMYDALYGLYAEDAARLDRDFFDTPVMTMAFAKAARETVPTPQVWKAQDIFSVETVRALRQTARKLGNLLQAHPGVWEAVDRRSKGYEKHVPPTDAEILAQSEVIEQVEATLAEAVALLASPAASAKSS